jgi:hypothetical protein
VSTKVINKGSLNEMYDLWNKEEEMRSKLSRIGAVLAFMIGIMAVVAGGRVLLGQEPGYYVIAWLPVYNFLAGLVSATLTTALLWRNHRLSMPLSLATLALHTIVMLVLLGAYRGVVAPDSLVAMTLRITVWVIISALLFIQAGSKGKAVPV